MMSQEGDRAPLDRKGGVDLPASPKDVEIEVNLSAQPEAEATVMSPAPPAIQPELSLRSALLKSYWHEKNLVATSLACSLFLSNPATVGSATLATALGASPTQAFLTASFVSTVAFYGPFIPIYYFRRKWNFLHENDPTFKNMTLPLQLSTCLSKKMDEEEGKEFKAEKTIEMGAFTIAAEVAWWSTIVLGSQAAMALLDITYGEALNMVHRFAVVAFMVFIPPLAHLSERFGRFIRSKRTF